MRWRNGGCSTRTRLSPRDCDEADERGNKAERDPDRMEQQPKIQRCRNLIERNGLFLSLAAIRSNSS
jgi:hypothetical protein